MVIGKYTYGAENVRTLTWGEGSTLSIGSFCSLSVNIVVYLGGNHRVDWVTTYPFGHTSQNVFNGFNGVGHPKTNGDVIIGNDVWIGSNATIMSGVKIGDGAVIENNSHIVKNVEPYIIVGGNPGKLIKQRFDNNTVKKLLQLRWWDLDDNTINEITPLLCSTNLDELFKRFNI